MELFSHISRAIFANLNDLVTKAEDPEKVIEESIVEMQEDLVQLRQTLSRNIAEQKRTEQRYKSDLVEANKWQKRADLAQIKGDEGLLRESLVRQETFLASSANHKTQLEEWTGTVNELRDDLMALECEISEVKTKRNILQVRARAAKANAEIKKTCIIFNALEQHLEYQLSRNSKLERHFSQKIEQAILELNALEQYLEYQISRNPKLEYQISRNPKLERHFSQKIEQAILGMQAYLLQLSQCMARMHTEQKLIEQRYSSGLEEANKWQERAASAQSKEDEELALTRKKTFTRSTAIYQALLDELTSQVDFLKCNSTTVEYKLIEVTTRKNIRWVQANITKAEELLIRLNSLLQYLENQLSATLQVEQHVSQKQVFIELFVRMGRGMRDVANERVSIELFVRIGRGVRVNLNNLVSKAEDPEKVMAQTVLDIEEELVQLRQGINRMIAEQKRIEKRYSEDLEEANKCNECAVLELSKGDEEAARKALVRKKSFTKSSAIHKILLGQLTSQIDDLQRNLTILESKIAEATTKKNRLPSNIAKGNEEL
jgi:phage shock protein A